MLVSNLRKGFCFGRICREDKFGGRLVSISKAIKFQECLNNCGMIDLGFSAPRYTWTNWQPLSHLIQERIDRVFINIDWNVLYPVACVKHLERSHSDHSPIVLSLRLDHGIQFPRPFRSNQCGFLTLPSLAWSMTHGLALCLSPMLSRPLQIEQKSGTKITSIVFSIERKEFLPGSGEFNLPLGIILTIS